MPRLGLSAPQSFPRCLLAVDATGSCGSNLSKCYIVSYTDMGVKDLWTILEPVKQHRRLTELRGQVIAVDLSIWIVEAKTLQLKGVTKPHLR